MKPEEGNNRDFGVFTDQNFAFRKIIRGKIADQPMKTGSYKYFEMDLREDAQDSRFHS